MSNCMCADPLCDGYSSSCWDEHTRSLIENGNRRSDQRWRLERAVIEAAKECANDWNTTTYTALQDAVDALIEGESQ